MEERAATSSSSVLQCCCILTSALLVRVASPMVQHLLTALKEPNCSQAEMLLQVLLVSCTLLWYQGRKTMFSLHSPGNLWELWELSGWLLLLLSWKQTAKNGACSFKLSIPSHRFLTLFCRVGRNVCLSCYGHVIDTLLVVEGQRSH